MLLRELLLVLRSPLSLTIRPQAVAVNLLLACKIDEGMLAYLYPELCEYTATNPSTPKQKFNAV
jgi:hypothetical protein